MKAKQKSFQILQLLSITMVSSRLLEQGGIFCDYRNAHKVLRRLRDKKYINFHKYKVLESIQYFYYPTKDSLLLLNREKYVYHEIKEATLAHDSMTALFLIHLFRCSLKHGIAMKWYKPFSIENKVCDGGIALARNGNVFSSILIETDIGTHDFSEIKEKILAYTKFLTKPHRKVVFLVFGKERKSDLQKLSQELGGQKQIFFVDPMLFPKNFDFFHKHKETH